MVGVKFRLAIAAGMSALFLAPRGSFAQPHPGFDQAKLNAAVECAQEMPRLKSLIVGRDGKITFQIIFRGPDLSTPTIHTRQGNYRRHLFSLVEELVAAATGPASQDTQRDTRGPTHTCGYCSRLNSLASYRIKTRPKEAHHQG